MKTRRHKPLDHGATRCAVYAEPAGSWFHPAAELGIAPETAYRWTRDIEQTEEQKQNNRSGPGGPWNPMDIRRRSYSWAKTCRNRRLESQRRGRQRALDGDPLHLAGCMLYWAEGPRTRIGWASQTRSWR